MTQPDLVRPHYRENQQLGVDDLDTEQAYLIATRRRHDVTAHVPGVAHGLSLAGQASGCVIAAGLAVDGLGRAVVLPDPVLLRWSDLPAGAAALDLFLSYREDVVADRVDEGADVHVTSVQPADGVAGPAGSVYLGRLVKGTEVEPPYVPVASQVTFLAAEGATVAAPTGTTVELANDPAVTVAVPDPDGRPVPRFGASPTQGTLVNGGLVTDALWLLEDQPVHFADPLPAPQAAWPWRWYHTEMMADGVVSGEQLRIELAAPAGTDMPDWYRFAVDDGSGVLPLSVDAGAATTVGTLTVNGTLVFGPLAPDPNDPRLVGTLVNTWLGAVDEVSRAVDQRFSGDLFDTSALTVTVAVVPPTPTPQATTAPATVTPPSPTSLDYIVTVSNGSAGPVTDLTIAAVTTVNTARSNEVLAKVPTLAAGATSQVTHTITLPGPGAVVHVEVVALGLLPGGRVTLGINDLDWQDTPPPPPVPAIRRTGRFFWR
jgi:hypothetical protein